jgi:ketosteroid isomerase-like protein
MPRTSGRSWLTSIRTSTGRTPGRVGAYEVRDYWTRQFAEIDPHVEPLEITTAGDETAVTVRQTVRSRDGEVLAESTVTHTYTIRDGRITRMDVSD